MKHSKIEKIVEARMDRRMLLLGCWTLMKMALEKDHRMRLRREESLVMSHMLRNTWFYLLGS